MSTTTTNLGLIKPELTDNVSITDINENMDKIDVATSENTNKIGSGWIPITGTFTYSNTTTITTSADCTSFLSAGMKLKCTNGTVKMSVIKSVTSTTIVLESAVLASGAITDVYFSTAQVPYGYTEGDFVVESGASGIWIWEKRKSGKCICYGSATRPNVAVTISEGGGYTSPNIYYTFPTGLFTSILYADAQFQDVGGWSAVSTDTAGITIRMHMTTSYTFTNLLVRMKIVGKWR